MSVDGQVAPASVEGVVSEAVVAVGAGERWRAFVAFHFIIVEGCEAGAVEGRNGFWLFEQARAVNGSVALSALFAGDVLGIDVA